METTKKTNTMDEQDPQVHNTPHKDEITLDGVRTGSHKILLPKRAIIAEPMLFLASLFTWPFYSCAQQYILHRITEDMLGNQTFSHDNTTCQKTRDDDPAYLFGKQVQASATNMSIYIDIARTVAVILVAPLLGPYSDKVGRRMPMFLGLGGLILNMGIYMVVSLLNFNIHFLILGAFLEGLLGSLSVIVMAGFSYITDITSIESRAFRIMMAEMSMMVPMTIGQVVVGYFIQWWGFSIPVGICLGGTLVNFIYCIHSKISAYAYIQRRPFHMRLFLAYAYFLSVNLQPAIPYPPNLDTECCQFTS